MSFHVKDNLDEFYKAPEWEPCQSKHSSSNKKDKKEKRMNDTNIVVQASSSENDAIAEESDQSEDLRDADFRMGCGSCGMKGHDVMEC